MGTADEKKRLIYFVPYVSVFVLLLDFRRLNIGLCRNLSSPSSHYESFIALEQKDDGNV